jgi:heat-inducible transcriptional repressor
MERTSHVLSLISHSVGVTVATSGPRNALGACLLFAAERSEGAGCGGHASGVVRDRVLRLDIPQSDLDLAARYINENFRGWTMGDMRAELARRLEQERSEYDRLMKSIAQLYQQGALASADDTQAVFVEGAANLRTTLRAKKIARACKTCCGRLKKKKKS